MKTVKEVLIAAKAVIASQGRWTHGSFAKDARGNACEVYEPQACRFCAMGAIDKAVYDDSNTMGHKSELAYGAIRVLKQHCRGNIVATNDFQGFDAVHKAFDEAINSLP